MYYRREGRRRRYENAEEQPRPAVSDKFEKIGKPDKPSQNRGARFTFFSFFAIGICLAIMKVANPDLPMRSPLLMFGGVMLACIMMYRIGRKKR